jgi:choline dehydrogenase-like flavoprotein
MISGASTQSIDRWKGSNVSTVVRRPPSVFRCNWYSYVTQTSGSKLFASDRRTPNLASSKRIYFFITFTMAPSSGKAGLTALQKTSLRALIDGLLPPLTAPRTQPQTKATKRYWETRLAADPVFLAAVEQAIANKLGSADRKMILSLLTMIGNPIGTSVVFGTLTLYPFAEWSVPQQTQLLQRCLLQSSLLRRRQVFSQVKRLVCGLAVGYIDPSTEVNPFWEAMGYPGPPQRRFVSPSQDATRLASATKQQLGIQQAMIGIERDTEIDCDVVIVGSGAGGSVAASVLSQAGYAVLIVEKGAHVPPDQITHGEVDALDKLHESKGTLTTTDGAISILAGSTVGGGMAVGWSCLVPLPEYVRDEWFCDLELEDFAPGGDYHVSLAAVLKRMGGNNTLRVKHNIMNAKFQEGCDALGYHWETTGQNMDHTDEPAAGYVGLGDRYGSKSSAIFLRDAAEGGASIIDKCRVEHIIKSYDGEDETIPRRMRATGLTCRVGDHELIINARQCVILSAGSLHTPCLLQQSGFRNQHIGQHLHLHPTTMAFGFMQPSEHIDCFLGAPTTTTCNAFELGPLHDGYGARLECPSVHPMQLATNLQWTKPDQFKDRIRRFRNAAVLSATQRDNGEGSVKLGKDGCTPEVNYVLSEVDTESLTKAIKGSLLVLLASGAVEVSSSNIRDPGFRINDHPPHQRETLQEEGEAITSYLSYVAKLGTKRHETCIFSTHQTGSCRMSSSPLNGAVDSNGETWECDDLHVLDASILPTASMGNPMLVVLAITHMLSKRLALRLRYRDGLLSGANEMAQADEISTQRTTLRSFEPSTPDWRSFIAAMICLQQGTAQDWRSSLEQIVRAHMSTYDWRAIAETLVSILLAWAIFFPIYCAWWLDRPPW